MRRTILLLVVGVATFAAGARGQPPAPAQYSPTFSPFLNLARRNASPTLNYYGLVRPQVEARAAAQNLQTQVQQNYQSINGLQQGQTDGTSSSLSPTGFRVGYMTHLAYFQNQGTFSGRAGAGGFGAANRNVGGQGAGFGSGVGGGGAPGFATNRPQTPPTGRR